MNGSPMRQPRLKPQVTYQHLVRNCSNRNVPMSDVSLIVIHDTQSANIKGLADLKGVGSWFDNPKSDASAHVCTDAEGNSARFVRDHNKAWSCVFYNSISLNIEQIGFAETGGFTNAQYLETARWVAFWSHLWGIPIRKGAVTIDGRVPRTGVVRHSELGRLGGAHKDPGPFYDMAVMLNHARAFRRRY